MTTLQQLQCPNCGAPLAWNGRYDQPITCPYCGSQFIPKPTDVDDVWLMTDRVARARYEHAGKLDPLEHDIRFEVLRGGTWSESDSACECELNRREREGAIRKLASFWTLSPFPPVSRARQDGQFILEGKPFSFRKGEELVWACPMTRNSFELDDPILIGDFPSERV